jgi:hypothetical protein
MVFELALSFLVAFFTKITDDLIDTNHSFKQSSKYLSAAVYGLAGGYLISLNGLTAALGLAIVLGVLFLEKIDQAHKLALGFIVLSIAFFGMPQVSLPLFGFLIVFALLDEWVDDWSEKKKGLGKLKRRILQERPLLPLACLSLGLLWQDFNLFYLILAFNLGYGVAGYYFYSFLKY